ncbi:MAG TPA: DUF4397 domain-containing protein [Terriglobales bacterium]|jgi:uncharacterized protein DUF4397|nr:DUF4397 domain-containing protein [Terriglobales bacterium]
MLRLLKALPLTLAIAAVSIVATSCNSNNGTKARFVNAIQNTEEYGAGNGGALDVEVNGTQQFTGVQFQTASASTYIPIPSGNVTIEGFESPGVTTPVFTDSTTLSSGTEYTEVVTGQAGGTGTNVVLLSLSDDNTLPEDGTLNFRVINASPNSPPGGVDIWIEPAPDAEGVTEPATIRNLAYQSVSGYVKVSYNTNPGGGFTVFVYTAGGGTELFTFPVNVSGSVSSASVCTLVLTDNPNGSSMSSFLVKLDDNNC